MSIRLGDQKSFLHKGTRAQGKMRVAASLKWATICALLCWALNIARQFHDQQGRVATPAACWTKDGGRYMSTGGVLRWPPPVGVASPRLARSSDLSYAYSGALPPGAPKGARKVSVASSPLVLEELGIMFCWIPKNR